MTALREILAAFHSGVAIVLEAYLDESFNTGQTRHFSMAAWIGDGPAWRELEDSWAPVLAESGIREFKAIDFETESGEFSGWKRERRQEFIDRLVHIIRSAQIVAVTTSLTIHEPGGRAERNGDYRSCVTFCMLEAARIATKYRKGERVAYVADERGKFLQCVLEVRKWLKLNLKAELAIRIGPAGMDDSVQVIPLQVADLLAYEEYRHVRRSYTLEPDRPSFLALRHMIARRHDYYRSTTLTDIPPELEDLIAYSDADLMKSDLRDAKEN